MRVKGSPLDMPATELGDLKELNNLTNAYDDCLDCDEEICECAAGFAAYDREGRRRLPVQQYRLKKPCSQRMKYEFNQLCEVR